MWTERTIALTLAVIHHGLSNFASGSIPAGWTTCVQTAEHFREYIADGTTPPNHEARGRR